MTNLDISKYVIAFLFQKEPNDINSEIELGYVKTTYIGDDGKEKIDKVQFPKTGKVIWGQIDGRWRDNALDGKITYRIKKGRITIREVFFNGYKNSRTFAIR